MKGDDKVLDYLNRDLRSEMTAMTSIGCIIEDDQWTTI